MQIKISDFSHRDRIMVTVGNGRPQTHHPLFGTDTDYKYI